METKQQLLNEITASESEYVTYGYSDLGLPVKKEDALADIRGMEEVQIGDGAWYECDENGNVDE